MSVETEVPTGPAAAPRPSVAAGSVARSAAEATWALFALFTGVVIARHLGPAGKGVVSSIGYLVALVAPAATFGLGEAAVTLVRGRGTDLRRALGATLGFLVVSTLAGAGLLLALVIIQFQRQLDILEGATAAALVSVPAMALWFALSLLVEAEGGLIASSVIKVLVAVVTAIATVVLVLILDLAQAGAIAAIAAGFLTGAVLPTAWLWRRGAAPLPRWDPGYLRSALRLGLPVQASYLLLGLAARMDLLVVQVIKGAGAAGLYSVALTMGQLVFYGPVAVAVASYPVAAGLSASEAPPFIERAGRTALAVGLLSTLVVAPVLPILVPGLFGDGFSDAVAMALILLPAGLLQGVQWVTCRLWAAQGRGALLAVSCCATLVSMLALDLVLVPADGARGAAIASLAASAIGAAVAVAGHCRYAKGSASLWGFVPGPADFARIAGLPRLIWRRLAGRRDP